MQTMSITELTAQFPDVLKVVKKGRRIGILNGRSKRPIAMLIPFAEIEDEKSSYEIGKNYFGKYGSGNGRISRDYKKLLKQKLHEKYSSR